MNIKTDLLPLFKKQTIQFVEYYKETGDIYTFVFDYEKPMSWIPGQHAMFFINTPTKKQAMHIFSVASIPSENKIIISTRIGNQPSDYKQALLALAKGDSLTIRGPIASFYIEHKKPTLLIAAGIGITPYRAIVHDISSNKDKNPAGTTLLYLDSNQEYAYKDEFDMFNNKEHIAVHYYKKREELNQTIIAFIKEHHNDASYFIAGPKAMEQAITAMLKEQGIAKKNIKKDSFIGY